MRVEPAPNSKYVPISELRLITRNYGNCQTNEVSNLEALLTTLKPRCNQKPDCQPPQKCLTGLHANVPLRDESVYVLVLHTYGLQTAHYLCAV